jgi:hypothetical protein
MAKGDWLHIPTARAMRTNLSPNHPKEGPAHGQILSHFPVSPMDSTHNQPNRSIPPARHSRRTPRTITQRHPAPPSQRPLCPSPPRVPPGRYIPFIPCASPLPTDCTTPTSTSSWIRDFTIVMPPNHVSHHDHIKHKSRSAYTTHLLLMINDNTGSDSPSTDAAVNNRGIRLHWQEWRAPTINPTILQNILQGCGLCSRRSQSVSSRGWNGRASITLCAYHIVPTNTPSQLMLRRIASSDTDFQF